MTLERSIKNGYIQLFDCAVVFEQKKKVSVSQPFTLNFFVFPATQIYPAVTELTKTNQSRRSFPEEYFRVSGSSVPRILSLKSQESIKFHCVCFFIFPAVFFVLRITLAAQLALEPDKKRTGLTSLSRHRR